MPEPRLRMEDVNEVVEKHHGQYAATNLEGEIYAFGSTPSEAEQLARQEMPEGEEPILFRVPETACAHFF